MIYYVLRPILENFANFVVPVVKAGATYCRRKCFRTVLGRKCGSFQDQTDDGGTRHLYGHAVGRSVRYLITAQVWSIGRLSLIGSYHNLLPGKQAVSTLSFCLCCVPAYAAFNFAELNIVN